MEFHITEDQRRLRERARCLADDFATRAAQHDREASHPLENYDALREAGLLRPEHSHRARRRGGGLARLFARRRGAGAGLPIDRARVQHAPVDRRAPHGEPARVRRPPSSASPDMVVRRAEAHRRQLLGADDVRAGRDARAADARPARGRGLSHHRPQGLCLDAGGRRLLCGAGLSGRRDRADRGHDPPGASTGRGATRRGGVGHAGHAGHPQRLHGPRRMLGVRRRRSWSGRTTSSRFAVTGPTGSGPPTPRSTSGSPSRRTRPSSRPSRAGRRQASPSPWRITRTCAGTWRR